MKSLGFLFLLSGAIIVLAALALLKGLTVFGFVFAGLAFQLTGLVLVALSHKPSGGNAA